SIRHKPWVVGGHERGIACEGVDMNGKHGQMRRRDFLKFSAGAVFAQAVPAWEARPANPKTVRPVSIDMHTHWAPEAYVKAQIDMGRPAPANRNPLDVDLDKRRKWMDEHGIQMHVLTLSGGMPWQWATPDEGMRLAQIVNDAAIEAHTAFPERFVAGIAMPVKDPAMALKELNRVAGKPGMRAGHLPNSMEQRDYLFEASFEPVLARCQELAIRCYSIRSMVTRTFTASGSLVLRASPTD